SNIQGVCGSLDGAVTPPDEQNMIKLVIEIDNLGHQFVGVFSNNIWLKGRHKYLERSCTSWKSVAPMRNKILVYPDSDEEDEEYCSLPLLLLCFQTPQPCATFNYVHHTSHSEVYIENMTLEDYARHELAIIEAKNIRNMEHEVPNRCDDITDYEDSDQEDVELPDLPTFSDTNEFTSVCEHVEENIDVNTARELEDVQVER
nr:hypothetical protein [Tanacetum cinerariifolium]